MNTYARGSGWGLLTADKWPKFQRQVTFEQFHADPHATRRLNCVFTILTNILKRNILFYFYFICLFSHSKTINIVNKVVN